MSEPGESDGYATEPGQKSMTFIPKTKSLTDLEDSEEMDGGNTTVTPTPNPTPQDKKKNSSSTPDSSGSVDGPGHGQIQELATTAEQTELETETQTDGEEIGRGVRFAEENQVELVPEDDGITTLFAPKFSYPRKSEFAGEDGGYQQQRPSRFGYRDVEFAGEGFDSSHDGYWQLVRLPEFVPFHISELDIYSVEFARELALYIIQVLDEDLEDYFIRTNIPPPTKFVKTRAYSGSNISLKEEWSDLVPDQPSTMRLYYEKGEPEFRELSITELQRHLMVDAVCEVNLHRNKRLFGRGELPQYVDGFSQTREMTLVSEELSEKLFRQLYPLKDDYRKPKTPERKASLNWTIQKAEWEDPTVDKARVGPKVRWSKKKRLLPPLPEDYYKVDTFWTGSTFRGEYVNRQFNHGLFDYPLMATYESEFKEGHIHSKKHLGIVAYPRGDTFEGTWRKGRHTSGKITFCDDLEFVGRNWDYCAVADRRFYIERDVGLKQAGRTLYNNRLPPPLLPPGCFDTGDGIYKPGGGVVVGYNGMKLREVTEFEHTWIVQNCRKAKEVEERYVPSFNVDRLPCSYVDNFIKQ